MIRLSRGRSTQLMPDLTRVIGRRVGRPRAKPKGIPKMDKQSTFQFALSHRTSQNEEIEVVRIPLGPVPPYPALQEAKPLEKSVRALP
jgi:hypothetical protein